MANRDRLTAGFTALIGLIMLALNSLAPGAHRTVEVIGGCLFCVGTVRFFFRTQQK